MSATGTSEPDTHPQSVLPDSSRKPHQNQHKRPPPKDIPQRAQKQQPGRIARLHQGRHDRDPLIRNPETLSQSVQDRMVVVQVRDGKSTREGEEQVQRHREPRRVSGVVSTSLGRICDDRVDLAPGRRSRRRRFGARSCGYPICGGRRCLLGGGEMRSRRGAGRIRLLNAHHEAGFFSKDRMLEGRDGESRQHRPQLLVALLDRTPHCEIATE